MKAMEMQDGFADEADTGVDLLVTLGFGVGAAADSDAEVVGELCGRRVGDAGDGAGVGGLPGVGAEQQSLGLSGVELGAAGGGEDGDGPAMILSQSAGDAAWMVVSSACM